MRLYRNVLEPRNWKRLPRRSLENSVCNCMDSTVCIRISLQQIQFLGICLLVSFALKSEVKINLILQILLYSEKVELKENRGFWNYYALLIFQMSCFLVSYHNSQILGEGNIKTLLPLQSTEQQDYVHRSKCLSIVE